MNCFHSRSLLARNAKGHLTAGIYFPLKLKDQQFTMFFDGHNGKQRKKLKFETFLELQKVSFYVFFISLEKQINSCLGGSSFRAVGSLHK